MPSAPGHNKASWEALAGQADNLRWLAMVRYKAQVLGLVREAEALYVSAEAVKGSPIPRQYPGGYDADGLV